jgi:AmmeMemoRadiSam system protein A
MNDDRGPVLLALARASIATALGQTCFADQSAPWLRDKGACFVTLKQGDELRGCVGHIEPRYSLLEAVTAAARAAAFEDLRFPPLSASELAITHIEVSQLSALEPMAALSEAETLRHIRPHVDGLLLESGRHRGIFLPQVWDSAPNARDFLGLLKLKAGLPPDFWSNEIRLHRFQVAKYSEPEIGRTAH